MNRCETLRRVLIALERHTFEPYHLLITDNGSSDNTPAMLTQYASDHPGQVDLWLLPENVGLARARNAHWARCIGSDTVRLDDKIQIDSPGWSQILRRQATQHHSLIAFLDPDTALLWDRYASEAEAVEYAPWKCGASMFIPAEVSAALGAWDEMTWPESGEPLLYGYEDLTWMDRAEAIGWKFKYSLSARATFLARASAATRATAQKYEPTYKARQAEYLNGERDIFIDIESTEGHAHAGQLQRASHARRGTAMELSYP